MNHKSEIEALIEENRILEVIGRIESRSMDRMGVDRKTILQLYAESERASKFVGQGIKNVLRLFLLSLDDAKLK